MRPARRLPATQILRWTAAWLGVAIVTACGQDTSLTDPDPRVLGPDPETIEYAAQLEVDLSRMTKTASGLFWQDFIVGTGETAQVGNFVAVRYNGWLPDGTLFDSNAAGTPFIFELGAGNVIAGWEEGVPGMAEGGVRRLIIPPDLAYGPTGAGLIPPNAVIIFDIEMINVVDEGG